jgi:hypothetical protein
MASIYKLIDPRCGSIRYIGKTSTHLNDRLKVHIHQSKKSGGKTYKEAWINQLLKIGLRPLIELVVDVSEDEWRQEEVRQISSHILCGHKLTNLTKGGDGVQGLKTTPERRLKLSQSMMGNTYGKGKKWTPEQREKMKAKRVWNKGVVGVVKFSEETKLKMKESAVNSWANRERKPKIVSEETRMRLSEAAKKDWAKRKTK